MEQELIDKIRAQFAPTVDVTDRAAMVKYLTEHERYHTLNSWNASTSYAHCVKIQRLPIPHNLRNNAYALLECEEWHVHAGDLLQDFDENHDHRWQVGFNGRSYGYVVLYQGGVKNGRPFCTPGKSLDMNADFDEDDGWDLDALQARVEVVRSFDNLVADLVIDFIDYAERFEVVDETIQVPQTIKVLKERMDVEA